MSLDRTKKTAFLQVAGPISSTCRPWRIADQVAVVEDFERYDSISYVLWVWQTSFFWSKSHSLIVLSSDPLASHPLGSRAIANEYTWSLWPVELEELFLPDGMSQILIVLSSEQLARLPQGRKSTWRIQSWMAVQCLWGRRDLFWYLEDEKCKIKYLSEASQAKTFSPRLRIPSPFLIPVVLWRWLIGTVASLPKWCSCLCKNRLFASNWIHPLVGSFQFRGLVANFLISSRTSWAWSRAFAISWSLAYDSTATWK